MTRVVGKSWKIVVAGLGDRQTHGIAELATQAVAGGVTMGPA